MDIIGIVKNCSLQMTWIKLGISLVYEILRFEVDQLGLGMIVSSAGPRSR